MINVTDKPTIDRHVDKVLVRAFHHAAEITAVVIALRGFVETCGEDIKVRPGGVTWFKSRSTGQRYAVSYPHEDRKVDLREGSQQGRTLYQFDNDTTVNELAQAFGNL
jgi:hypothetical protein